MEDLGQHYWRPLLGPNNPSALTRTTAVVFSKNGSWNLIVHLERVIEHSPFAP